MIGNHHRILRSETVSLIWNIQLSKYVQTEASLCRNVINGDIKVQLSSLCRTKFCPGIRFHFSHVDVTSLSVSDFYRTTQTVHPRRISQFGSRAAWHTKTDQNTNLCVISEPALWKVTWPIARIGPLPPTVTNKLCALSRNSGVAKRKYYANIKTRHAVA
jgi:hypothetical protein